MTPPLETLGGGGAENSSGRRAYSCSGCARRVSRAGEGDCERGRLRAPCGLGRHHGAGPGRLRGLQPRPQRSRRHARLSRVHVVPFVNLLAAVLGAPLHAGGTGRGPVLRTQGHPRRRCHAARAPASCPMPVTLHPPARQALKGPQGLLPWSCRGEVTQ